MDWGFVRTFGLRIFDGGVAWEEWVLYGLLGSGRQALSEREEGSGPN